VQQRTSEATAAGTALGAMTSAHQTEAEAAKREVESLQRLQMQTLAQRDKASTQANEQKRNLETAQDALKSASEVLAKQRQALAQAQKLHADAAAERDEAWKAATAASAAAAAAAASNASASNTGDDNQAAAVGAESVAALAGKVEQEARAADAAAVEVAAQAAQAVEAAQRAREKPQQQAQEDQKAAAAAEAAQRAAEEERIREAEEAAARAAAIAVEAANAQRLAELQRDSEAARAAEAQRLAEAQPPPLSLATAAPDPSFSPATHQESFSDAPTAAPISSAFDNSAFEAGTPEETLNFGDNTSSGVDNSAFPESTPSQSGPGMFGEAMPEQPFGSSSDAVGFGGGVAPEAADTSLTFPGGDSDGAFPEATVGAFPETALGGHPETLNSTLDFPEATGGLDDSTSGWAAAEEVDGASFSVATNADGNDDGDSPVFPDTNGDAFPEASGEVGWSIVPENGAAGAGAAAGDGFGAFPEATTSPVGFGDDVAAFPDVTPEASSTGAGGFDNAAFPEPAAMDDGFGSFGAPEGAAPGTEGAPAAADFSAAFGDSDPFAAPASGSSGGDDGFGF